jgi:hypothetical protein
MPFVDKEIYTFGHFVLEPAERVLSCEGTPVYLTPKAFDTLLCLVRNPGRMLHKRRIAETGLARHVRRGSQPGCEYFGDSQGPCHISKRCLKGACSQALIAAAHRLTKIRLD